MGSRDEYENSENYLMLPVLNYVDADGYRYFHSYYETYFIPTLPASTSTDVCETQNCDENSNHETSEHFGVQTEPEVDFTVNYQSAINTSNEYEIPSHSENYNAMQNSLTFYSSYEHRVHDHYEDSFEYSREAMLPVLNYINAYGVHHYYISSGMHFEQNLPSVGGYTLYRSFPDVAWGNVFENGNDEHETQTSGVHSNEAQHTQTSDSSDEYSIQDHHQPS